MKLLEWPFLAPFEKLKEKKRKIKHRESWTVNTPDNKLDKTLEKCKKNNQMDSL